MSGMARVKRAWQVWQMLVVVAPVMVRRGLAVGVEQLAHVGRKVLDGG